MIFVETVETETAARQFPVHVNKDCSMRSLIIGLGSVEKAAKTPTAKALREAAGEPILSSADGSIKVYGSGYGVYRTDMGATVLWLPDCTSFTYHFDPLRENERCGIREKEEIPEETFLELPWEVAISLIGSHRLEANLMNRKGNRRGQRSDMGYDGDEADAQECMDDGDIYQKAYNWHDGRFGESPESAYIRKETQREMLDKLTDKQREVFVMYYRDGLTQQEIADVLKISQQSVMERLEWALKRLKKIF